MGWAERVDQGIAGLFLEGFTLHGADGQSQGGVLTDQGAIRSLADSEQDFSHERTLRALLARIFACCVLTATARLTVSWAVLLR
jgi:hypothetical protein